MLKFGEAIRGTRVFEGHGIKQSCSHDGRLRVASENFLNKTNTLDVSWLPMAAEQYQISPNIKDYVINEIPIVTVGVPNRNLDEFPFEEVTSFSPDYGRLVYQSFIGKPTHINHQNRDIKQAKGVMLDASLRKLDNGQYKIVVLAGWDRTKDREVAEGILNRTRNAFSMGALVGYTQCSYPGCEATSPNGKIACRHQEYGRGKGRVMDGQIIYERCYRVAYIETSAVDDGADHTAIGTWAVPFS